MVSPQQMKMLKIVGVVVVVVVLVTMFYNREGLQDAARRAYNLEYTSGRALDEGNCKQLADQYRQEYYDGCMARVPNEYEEYLDDGAREFIQMPDSVKDAVYGQERVQQLEDELYPSYQVPKPSWI